MLTFELHDIRKHGWDRVAVMWGEVKSAFTNHPYLAIAIPLVLCYLGLVRCLRYRNINRLKQKYGFTADKKSYKNMTVEQAQEIERNMAEWDFPCLFEFGWIVEFLKTASAPCLSKVIVESGHFCSPDPMLAHARQQDTVCLMTAMMAQPLGSEFSSLVLARINEHHTKYGDIINSDTVLWLSWMWMNGPVQWISRGGWRKLEPFEVHAMWIFWRELSVRMGCKWVPYHLEELEHFREQFQELEQKPSTWNIQMSDAIIDDICYKHPSLFKPTARKCIIAILDADVVWANGYTPEFNPTLRRYLLGLFSLFGFFQRHFCLPRFRPRVLTPLTADTTRTVNFPDYTFPNTPFYVAPTIWNQYGPFALLDRLRGMPLPSAHLGGNGVKWESMGAKLKSENLQLKSEARVREQARAMMWQPWGWRAKTKFQSKPIVVDRHWGEGYGSRENAYTIAELEPKRRWVSK